MFNKTDSAQSSDAEKNASFISSEVSLEKVTDSSIKRLRSNGRSQKNANSPLNRANGVFKRLNLGSKATLLAIAISTLPVLAIGSLAYHIASFSISNKLSALQQAEAEGLANKVNRFMIERYGDIQVLASLPILINSSVKGVTTQQDREAVLNKIVESYKVYDSIAVFDLKGEPILQSQGEPLTNHSDRDYFQLVLKSGRPLISKPEVSKSTRLLSIFMVSPVKDAVTGETIAIVRTRMPVKNLEEVIKNYSFAGQEYHLIDASGKFFMSSQTKQIGREAKINFPGLGKLQATKKEATFKTINQINNKEQLVSYAAENLNGLPDLKWQVILATDTAMAFAPERDLLLAILGGTALTTLLVSLVAGWLAKRAIQPILNATQTVARLGQGQLNTRLEINSQDELGELGENINLMAEQLQMLLKEQQLDAERAKIITEITLRIRRNLKSEDIFKTAVREVRSCLKSDRLVIYKLDRTTWEGIIVAESVAPGYPKMMGVQIDDPCFRDRHVETYKDGRVRAIANIYQEASLQNANCYIKMLEKFSVKANLIAPMIIDGQLVGLMIAHQCDSPRFWQQAEMDLFKQIATQVGYALEQAKLLEELEERRHHAEQGSEDERHQKEALQMQLLELLGEVEGAARGDLTVRADVTTGEIGTVADFFNSIVENLRLIVTQVKLAAYQVNYAIGSNEGAMRELAEDAIFQASEINRTLDTVDQMTYSIQYVAENAQQAAKVAQNASHTAKKSGKAMDMTVQNILKLRETIGETAKKVKRLGESTQQISRVVSLINQIAMQTNLLAINAGIEAARAGEEGQGFAVVAEEVGELAARSAAATKEIEQIVENIQRETSEVVQAMEVGTAQVVEGTRIVEDAKSSLSQILDVSRQIDSLVQSISTATTSQVETSQTVSQLMREIAKVSERTSYSSRQVSESLQQTAVISQELQETVETFKVD
ncbi:methyl-accepting chemotaxis protein [Plectonema radiosum NIES-515]|uniref:Methyl-accepting chemotaxis protein n=1 Tax=Plectonema radiosum NIES-515 TaxID=2986073 RepID=A0ABT3ASR8_9CYAN|nr:methyl-accepting chemotaxis protein [Plectonema radiosum]MCV3212150.1 methyl-accepting chemotaxis protein [Plectonema radiosum NIES-515]